jgi:hypothetical protein
MSIVDDGEGEGEVGEDGKGVRRSNATLFCRRMRLPVTTPASPAMQRNLREDMIDKALDRESLRVPKSRAFKDVIIEDEMRSSITGLNGWLPAIDMPSVLCK